METMTDNIALATGDALRMYSPERLAQEIERLRESHVEDVRMLAERHKQDIHVIGESAIALADEHGWCSTYDDFVEDLNCRLNYLLPTRESNFRIGVWFVVHATGTVTARTSEEAREIWNDNHSWLDLSINDSYVEIDDVEISNISVEPA